MYDTKKTNLAISDSYHYASEGVMYGGSHRPPTIGTEILRAELERDCLAAGYTPGDAGRLADRIIGGRLLPGLAVVLDAARVTGDLRCTPTRSAIDVDNVCSRR